MEKKANLAADQNVVINMVPKVISDLECFRAFRDQLKNSGLPYEDLNKDRHLLIGYYENEELVGTGGVEIYGNYGLIRSISVVQSERGKNIGSKITYHLIGKAKESRLKELYLLTETAKGFFHKIGFEEIERSDVAVEVRGSSEFLHVCPDTAVCMHLSLNNLC